MARRRVPDRACPHAPPHDILPMPGRGLCARRPLEPGRCPGQRRARDRLSLRPGVRLRARARGGPAVLVRGCRSMSEWARASPSASVSAGGSRSWTASCPITSSAAPPNTTYRSAPAPCSACADRRPRRDQDQGPLSGGRHAGRDRTGRTRCHGPRAAGGIRNTRRAGTRWPWASWLASRSNGCSTHERMSTHTLRHQRRPANRRGER